MPVFCRGRRALITHRVFETVHLGRLQFPIKDLANVHIVRLDSGQEPGGRILGLSALFAAFLVVPIVGPSSKIVAALTIVTLLVGSATNLRRRSRVRWVLVAICQGEPVSLFQSDDRTEFDQVSRSLQRALEQHARDR